MAIRIHFGPIYAKRRYDRWNIPLDISGMKKGRKDKVPLYRGDVDRSFDASKILRMRKQCKYQFPRWELHGAGFYDNKRSGRYL